MIKLIWRQPNFSIMAMVMCFSCCCCCKMCRENQPFHSPPWEPYGACIIHKGRRRCVALVYAIYNQQGAPCKRAGSQFFMLIFRILFNFKIIFSNNFVLLFMTMVLSIIIICHLFHGLVLESQVLIDEHDDLFIFFKINVLNNKV